MRGGGRNAWTMFIAEKARMHPGVPANILAAQYSAEYRAMTGRGGCY